MARSDTRPTIRGFAASRSVHNFSDSGGEEFVSRETSPMQLLDEICKREEEEDGEKGRGRILSGLVQSRKQLLEAAIEQQEEKVWKRSPRSSDESSGETNQSTEKDRRRTEARPRQLRSFVGLKNGGQQSENNLGSDFSAISGLPQLDRLVLQLSDSRSREAASKETSPSLSEVSEASSSLTSVSLQVNLISLLIDSELFNLFIFLVLFQLFSSISLSSVYPSCHYNPPFPPPAGAAGHPPVASDVHLHHLLLQPQPGA